MFEELNMWVLLLIMFVGISILNLIIYWYVPSRWKFTMLVVTLVEVIGGVFLFILYIFIAFPQSTAAQKNSEVHVEMPMVKDGVLDEGTRSDRQEGGTYLTSSEVSKKGFGAYIHSALKDREAQKLFLTAEGLKKKNLIVDALRFYERCYKHIEHKKNKLIDAMLLFKMGDMNRLLDNSSEAICFFLQALTIFQKQDHAEGTMVTLNRLGRVYHKLSQYPQAKKYFEQSLIMAQKREDAKEIGSAHRGLADIEVIRGDMDKAIWHYDKAQAYFEEQKNKKGVSYALLGKGRIYRLLGDKQNARYYLYKAQEILSFLEDSRSEAKVLIELGRFFDSIGNYEQSCLYLSKAAIIFKRIHSSRYLALSLLEQAQVHEERGDYMKALEQANEALPLFVKIKDKRLQGHTLFLKGRILTSQARFAEAEKCLEEAKKIVGNIGDIRGQAEVMLTFGIWHLLQGKIPQAQDYLERSKQLFLKQKFLLGVGRVNLSLGWLAREKRDYDLSRMSFYKALKIFKQIESGAWEARTLIELSLLEVSFDNTQHARWLVESAMEIIRGTNDKFNDVRAWRSMGLIEYKRGHYEAALRYWDRAQDILKVMNVARDKSKILAYKAELYIVQGKYDRAQSYLTEAYNLAKGASYTKVRTYVMGLQGTLYLKKGQTQKALEKYKKMQSLAALLPNTRLLSRSFEGIAQCQECAGDYKAADKNYEKAAQIAETAGDKSTQARVGALWAIIKLKMGETAEGREMLENSVAYFRQVKKFRWLGISYIGLGYFFYVKGDLEQARHYLEKALNIFRRITDEEHIAEAWGVLANIYHLNGQLMQEGRALEDALAIAERIQNKPLQVYLKSSKRDLLRASGAMENVIENFQASFREAKEAGNAVEMAYALCGLSYAAEQSFHFQESRKYAEQALTLFSKVPHMRGKIESLLHMGTADLKLGRFSAASEMFSQALQLARKHGYLEKEMRVLRRVGVLEFEQGHNEKALQNFESSLSLARRLNNLRGEARVLRHIAKVRSIMLGEYQYPKQILLDVLQRFKENNDFLYELDCQVRLADLEFLFGFYDKAREGYSEALQLATYTHQKSLEPSILEKMGDTYANEKKIHESIKCYSSAAIKCDQHWRCGGKARLLYKEAQAYQKLGEEDNAQALYKQALILIPEGKGEEMKALRKQIKESQKKNKPALV